MSLQIGAMMIGLMLVCAVALWGVRGLRSNLGSASAGYRELREMYEVAAHVSIARSLLNVEQREAAGVELDRALTKLDLALSRESSGSVLRESSDGVHLATAFRDSIRRAAIELKLPANDDAFHSGMTGDSINQAFADATGIALSIRTTIANHERAADRQWRQTIALVAVVSFVAILAAVMLGISQYRSVVLPLRSLGSAARRMANGRFDDRVERRGANEFIDLADDFNRMATELQTLYRDLEAKVATASRELVQSERLASVGYLAAGVAHEINNPLSVIAGYAERAIQQLERGVEPAHTLKHLKIICDETYRCKSITDKLLSMARPGEGNREKVLLAKVAREVAAVLSELPMCKDHKLILQVDESVAVLANPEEIKQVLANLTVNAMAAISPEGGEVCITVDHDELNARVIVADNGRGMTAETLARVFEPFYTEKRGSQAAGTGLGLAISHAIIKSHGGRIHAASEGLGRGSQFMIELPLVKSQIADLRSEI